MTVTRSLNGTWLRRVGMCEEKECTVPYSTLPVGRSFCRRVFTVEKGFKRLFLRFDGITYHADVFLNGEHIGEMLPYCEYEFEITDKAAVGENELGVEIEDIDLPFGPTPGWENFGGIIRGVSLIYRDESYISNVFFKSKLINGYRDATVNTEISVDGVDNGVLTVELTDADGKTVLSYETEQGSAPGVTVNGVHLWSPDEPYLYTLSVKLTVDGTVTDEYTCKVGFRELKCLRHRFLFNGSPLFLKGVCKHEMIGDSGHAVTPEMIEKDMLRIKATGVNFVRLVHYPHCKETLEIADRIGLMVSEEPGLWWSDTSDERVANGSLEVLRRTVIRDRNHASILFWLCFNECRFTEKFLIDSAELCRKYDPTRPVSGANCMSDEDTLIYFNKCGFDFYTMHPYSSTVDRFTQVAKILHDKPLVFTEWGGYHVFDKPEFMTECIRQMVQLYHANSDKGALAGAFIWCWADVNDFCRGFPCRDGVLPEGLVTMEREKHICYDVFCREIAAFDRPCDYKALQEISGKPLTAVSDGADFYSVIEGLNIERPKQFMTMRPYRVSQGQRLKKVDGIYNVPKLVTDTDSVAFEGEGMTDTVTLIGATGINKGYPISGGFGEEVASVTVYFDGGEKSFILRNGREFTASYMLLGSSRIDPIADGVTRFAEFSYDKNIEQYVINRLELRLDGMKKVRRVEIASAGNGYISAFYGAFI